MKIQMFLRKSILIFAAISVSVLSLSAEELISGRVLNHFEDTSGWHLVDTVSTSPEDARNFTSSPAERGKILLNGDARIKRLPYLLTKKSYGDVEVILEFMIPQKSNAGIYLMGRYEVQILDSYGKSDVTFSDMGGIYERWVEGELKEGQKRGYEGTAPLVNAAEAAGQWQRYDIRFRAPRFDRDGNKIKDALFESVYLNGELVQQDVSVSGPTVSNPIQGKEAKVGPISIQGDHGPVAIRSFTVKPLRN